MADISFVKLPIAKLAMRYAGLGGDLCQDDELGIVHGEGANERAELLEEAEGYRRAEVERKRRAKEDREAAAKARGHASAESAESTERDHRSDQSKAYTQKREGGKPPSTDSLESAESVDLLAGEHQAGPLTGSQDSQGARPKRGGGETPKAEKNIIPPSLDMVDRFCKNRKNGIDPMKFLAHYAQTDWKTRKGRITNWQACVVTWEKNKEDFKAMGGRRANAEPVGPLV